MTEGQPPQPPATSASLASLATEAFAGRCPRCGNATLFGTMLGFADRCRACSLDYRQFNVGDGPAAFLILILGGIVTMLAIILQISASPPFWVHILLWVPLTSVAVVGCLRLSKAALLILEYRNQAREGRIVTHAPDDNP